ncbi:MAG TPA: DUF2892 domain-containing protein [Nitrospirales bacterium]|jgi:hypothetical protein
MKDLMPDTPGRVPQHTDESVNRQIRERMQRDLTRYVDAAPFVIEQRLKELDREWDIERTLEANAATFSLIGLGLGTFVDRRWYWLPVAVGTFLLQHAFHGWCPPVPLLRRLGVRTEREIDYERYALKALRGDFRNIPAKQFGSNSALAAQAFGAARR